jgi:hypothetical protein
MRLISQSKKTDIPYDLCVLSVCCVKNDNYGIFAWVNGATEPIVMCEYSTEEKALKVMGIIRRTYISIIPGIDEMPDEEIKKTEEMAIDGNIGVVYDSSKIFDGYFCFPADDKVEV